MVGKGLSKKRLQLQIKPSSHSINIEEFIHKINNLTKNMCVAVRMRHCSQRPRTRLFCPAVGTVNAGLNSVVDGCVAETRSSLVWASPQWRKHRRPKRGAATPLPAARWRRWCPPSRPLRTNRDPANPDRRNFTGISSKWPRRNVFLIVSRMILVAYIYLFLHFV